MCAAALMINASVTVFAASENPADSNYKKKNVYYLGNEQNCLVVISNEKAFVKSWNKALRTVYRDAGYDFDVYTLRGKHNHYWLFSDEVQTIVEAEYRSNPRYKFEAAVITSGDSKWTGEKSGRDASSLKTGFLTREKDKVTYAGFAHK